ncbi:hypothetical protein TrRE_jg613, partial [Triparma retinervis]
MKALVP